MNYSSGRYVDKLTEKKKGSFLSSIVLVGIGVFLLEYMPTKIVIIFLISMAGVSLMKFIYKKTRDKPRNDTDGEFSKYSASYPAGGYSNEESMNEDNIHDLGRSILAKGNYHKNFPISEDDYKRRSQELEDLLNAGIIENSEYSERMYSLKEEL